MLTHYSYTRLTVEVTAAMVGAATTGAVAVILDDSGSVLAVPLSNSSVTPPNMETPPTGGFPFGLSKQMINFNI